jgi:hypothetical protein
LVFGKKVRRRETRINTLRIIGNATKAREKKRREEDAFVANS